MKKEESVLKAGTDYVLSNEGDKVTIVLLSSGAGTDAQSLKVTSKSVDPSAITAEDVIGGYDTETGKETGLECLRQVYVLIRWFLVWYWLLDGPMNQRSAAVMQAKTKNLNEIFNTFAVIDIDTDLAKVYTKVKEVKDQSGINSERAVALWPMVSVNGKKAYYSAYWSAMAAYTDAQNGDPTI